MESFLEETRRHLLRMGEASGRGDTDELSAVAHKMIPLFTLIGAGQTVRLLRRLEAAQGMPWDATLQAVATDAMAGVEGVLRAVRD